MPQININAIAYEEDGVWVVQGLEYDIVASTANLKDLPKAFVRAVFDNLCITHHLGRQPLEGISPGPAHLRALFERAKVEMRPLDCDFEGAMIRPEVALRVLEQGIAA